MPIINKRILIGICWFPSRNKFLDHVSWFFSRSWSDLDKFKSCFNNNSDYKTSQDRIQDLMKYPCKFFLWRIQKKS